MKRLRWIWAKVQWACECLLIIFVLLPIAVVVLGLWKNDYQQNYYD